MKKYFLHPIKYLFLNKLRCVVFFVFFLFFSEAIAQTATNSSYKNDSLAMADLNKRGRSAVRKGDFEESILNFKQALSIGKKLYGDKSLRIFSPLINMGILYKNLGEYDKAIECYAEAESIIKRVQSKEQDRLGYVYAAFGTIYKLQGDYVKNFEYQKEALNAFKIDSLKNGSNISDAKYNIAEAQFLLGKYKQAITSCMQNIFHVDDDFKSFYYSLLARIYNEIGNFDLANSYYKKTIQILKKIKGEEHYELAMEYVNYSGFLLENKHFESALAFNKLSEPILEKVFTQKSLQYSDVMMNYADYYFLKSSEASVIHDFKKKREADIVAALDYYQRAIISATDGFQSKNVLDNPMVSQAISEIQLLEIMKKKAHCFEEMADINLSMSKKHEAMNSYWAALDAISLSTELVHQIRTGFMSEDSRFFLAENQDATFIEAVRISFKLYQLTGDQQYVEKGFEFAEKSKSASFLAAVRDSKAKEFGGIPDSLLKREDYFKINISNYKEMLFEENQNDHPDSSQLAFYNSKIFQLNEEYQKLIQLFEDSFPNYYSFKYLNKVADIESVRSGLSDKEALIEYLIGEPGRPGEEGEIYRFVITQDNLSFIASNVQYNFVENIEFVHGFLSSPNYLLTSLNDYKGYVKSGYGLYADLIEPGADIFEGKQLIIVPDDKLSYIPFDALLSSMADTTRLNFRNLPYLVNDYSVSYTYSATLLFDYFASEKRASNDMLVFAPHYSSTPSEPERAALHPIPGVEKEVSLISKHISSDVYKDAMAMESEFKLLAPDYDILHLAMHTIINDTLPMFSKMAFSSPNRQKGEDGWLNTNEIYTMALKARMAVLSACNTGSGKLQKGEGVMSLARAFLYAGCPSIVMTLWEVEDESGAGIMNNFYRLISKGKGKNEALRLAKLEHIKHADPLKAHPHYWLGYVAVGNPDPLYFGKQAYLVLAILAIVLLLVLDQIYRKRKARRKPGS